MNDIATSGAPVSSLDPITVEVICEGLIAIVREMRASIIRAAYSSAIYEFDDFSCALFDPKCQMVAQSWDHPGHVLPLPWSVRSAFDEFRDNLAPGDILLLNDPYRGGTHLNDVTLIYPLFDERGQMTIFPAVRAHWVDVGGMVPGSYSGLSTNIYQEGVRIPPIKIYEAGQLNKAAMALLLANMRIPEEREGDFQASLGACRVAERRIRSLYQRYSRDTVHQCVTLNLDRTERRLRRRIAELPAGQYSYEDYLEFYEEGRFDPVLLRLTLTIAGDRIVADFAGSNPQVPGVVNSSLAVAAAGVFVAVKSTLDPRGAVNQGAFRPLEFRAPEASIVNVQSDAPAGAHGELRKRAVSVALGALSQVIPELISGDLCGTSFPNAIGGVNHRSGRQYVYYEVPAGGNGGFREADGSSAFVNVDFGNLPSIQTAESIESEMPLLVESCSLRADSGGEGEHRGGLGMERRIRLLENEATYSVLSDRAVIPPFGVLGGSSALPCGVTVGRCGEEFTLDIPGKATGLRLRKDDTVIMRSAGGGGYGDPLKRDPEAVRDDVVTGRISWKRARDGYGVILDANHAVDLGRTDERRSELSARRHWVQVIENDDLVPYCGVRGKRRVLDLAPALAEAIGATADDLIELCGRNPAPLRAWVRIQTECTSASIALDAYARQVLGVSGGDLVHLRRIESARMPQNTAGSIRDAAG